MAEIKILRPEDRAILQGVAEGVFDGPVDDALAAEFLNDSRHHIAVVIDSDRVAGFTSGVHYVHPDKGPELWINELGVASNHRRRGLGKKLLEVLLQRGAQLGCREAWVLTERSNAAAIRLFESSGGVENTEEIVMFSFDLRR